MKIFITTDTHFNHKKLIEYGRPEDFEKQIKSKLKRVVNKNDLLIHLGDVCIGKDKENNNWFKKNLGCRTFLVRGNHDKKSLKWYMHNGWDSVSDRLDIKKGNKTIAFTHKPIKWTGDFDINIHGHLHDTDGSRHPEFDISIMSEHNKLISLENIGYEPVLLDEIVN